MGTRADFYVGTGETAEWLGSIGWDGYPDGNPADLIRANSEAEYRELVAKCIAENRGRLPKDGWPWPWRDSRLTDYSYAWVSEDSSYPGVPAGKVVASAFGRPFFDPLNPEPVDEDNEGPSACSVPGWDDDGRNGRPFVPNPPPHPGYPSFPDFAERPQSLDMGAVIVIRA
jgi:hypothetical protein